MTTDAELNQFVRLWEMIQGTQLTNEDDSIPAKKNEDDSIKWNISLDGQYSAASVYGIHLSQRTGQAKPDPYPEFDKCSY
jgi:hypothetical protein